MTETDESGSDSIQFLDINTISHDEHPLTPRAKIEVLINNKSVQMELDTGGACSIISEECLHK